MIFYIRQLHIIIKTNFLNTHPQPMIFTKSPRLANRLHAFSDMRRQSQVQANNSKKTEIKDYGGLKYFVEEKRQMGKDYLQEVKNNLPTDKLRTFYRDHLVEVTLYMKHDDWKSQYIYSVMNYQKLGFRPVSDYAFLDSAIYNFDLKKVAEQQRWPLIRFRMPVSEQVVIRGWEQIYKYLSTNNLFRFQIQNDVTSETLEQYIEESIVPHLQSLFWHPRLTVEYTFHTNLSSYQHRMINYTLVGIFYRNVSLCLRRVVSNVWKIMQNREQYLNSKSKLTQGFRELEKMLMGRQFMGGDQPNHLDFYLFALLNTKMNGRLFENYLRNEVKDQFWGWLLRMRSLSQYDRERVTLM